MAVPKNLTKTVSAAGTAEALSATALWVVGYIVKPLAANTGNVYVGDSDVDNTGMPWAAGEPFSWNGDFLPRADDKNRYTNLAEVYIDVDTNDEGVDVLYEPVTTL